MHILRRSTPASDQSKRDSLRVFRVGFEQRLFLLALVEFDEFSLAGAPACGGFGVFFEVEAAFLEDAGEKIGGAFAGEVLLRGAGFEPGESAVVVGGTALAFEH